jgi:light-regulated signal transduction histidine kinase (bacteriophytochrome)
MQLVDYGIIWSFLLPAAVIAMVFVFVNRRLGVEIEQRRIAEKKLRSTVEQLEAANHQLKSQNDELDAYAHTTAHSLKTPLAATGRFLDILANYHEDSLSEEQGQLIENAAAALDMGTDAVDALLLLSTVSNEDVELETLDMAKLVEGALDQTDAERRQASAIVEISNSLPDA